MFAFPPSILILYVLQTALQCFKVPQCEFIKPALFLSLFWSDIKLFLTIWSSFIFSVKLSCDIGLTYIIILFIFCVDLLLWVVHFHVTWFLKSLGSTIILQCIMYMTGFSTANMKRELIACICAVRQAIHVQGEQACLWSLSSGKHMDCASHVTMTILHSQPGLMLPC